MNSLYTKVLEAAGATASLKVTAIHIATGDIENNKSAKFGAIELEDGTVGLTYTRLGDALTRLQDEALYQGFIGKPVSELAELYLSDEPWQQVLGAAALNGISQSLLTQRQFSYPKSEDSLALLNIQDGDRVGMVGYFPPLVEQLQQQGIGVTVIELRRDLAREENGLLVTDDTAKLAQCTKVLITGTTVINHTLESVLSHCQNATDVALVGPSVSLLPELLFEMGITAIGGRAVLNTPAFLERWKSGDKWKDSVVRYSLRKADY
ncbi:DUF364 domain-containing protein [Ferrimonas aestuarii]|uniref:Heavy-metal chelation domain-containing protein n=1 Tax=Ferrimonas aestuarii TaxID=2569539 RepID=A0A4U1BRS8_9GAMM|nr:DUF364 domain-containing protein [Ferrimonas aestuarii]TKB58323.1 hypothetical protein FCL42_00815 [Ferrimonas aestuarii]